MVNENKRLMIVVVVFSIITIISCSKPLQNVEFDYFGDKLVLNGYVDLQGHAQIVVSRTQHPNIEFHEDSLFVNEAIVYIINGTQEIPLSLIKDGLFKASSFQLDTNNLIKVRASAPGFSTVESESILFSTVPEIKNKGRNIIDINESVFTDDYFVDLNYNFTIKDSSMPGDQYLIFANALNYMGYLAVPSMWTRPQFVEQFSEECFTFPCFQDDCFNGLEIPMEIDAQIRLQNLELLSDESDFLDKIEIFVSKVDANVCRSLSLGNNDYSPLPFILNQSSLTSSNIINGYGHVVGSNAVLISR